MDLGDDPGVDREGEGGAAGDVDGTGDGEGLRLAGCRGTADTAVDRERAGGICSTASRMKCTMCSGRHPRANHTAGTAASLSKATKTCGPTGRSLEAAFYSTDLQKNSAAKSDSLLGNGHLALRCLGSNTVNTVPSSAEDWTSIEPSCPSTTSRAM